MGAVQDAVDTWLRDYVVAGNPGSGVNQPSKSEGRAVGGLIEQAIADAVAAGVSAGGAAKLILDISRDESTDLTTGTSKFSFRLPYGMLLSEVRASVSTTSSSGDVKMDVNLEGVSIMTDVVQIDASDTTSVGSAAPMLILTHELPDNGLITFDIDAAGTGAKGLKAYLLGTWAAIGVGRIPYFVACGAVTAVDSQSTTVAYPAGLQLDDIAILEVRSLGIAATGTPTIARPSGWTTIANPVGPSGSTAGDPHSDVLSTTAWFWKRLDGTETGSISISSTGGSGSVQGLGARMILFRGCVANGDPYESAISNSGDSTTMDSTTLVTLGPNRLACNFYACVDNANVSDPDTGWTESYDDSFAFTFGSQQHSLSVAQMPVAASTLAETRTIGSKAAWSSLSLALVPAIS